MPIVTISARALGGAEDRRRRVADRVRRPIGLPSDLACLAIERHQVRAPELVDELKHEAVGDDRRRRHAVEVLKRAHPVRPQHPPVRAVRHQAEIGEEGHDAALIRRRRGRGRVVRLVHLHLPFAVEGAAPERLARPGVDRDREELVAFDPGQVEAAGRDDRGRLAERNGGLPRHVRRRRELRRVARPVANPRPVRPAELRPLGTERGPTGTRAHTTGQRSIGWT